ncbi:TetR/AcrR family transcriptional regulator [Qipengyuania qiaonensis]|uniref:TetR/AcrR family transcriptional regulator n=1 Tax=Qipengyuania qiaonensis TaxID=2867240 RepID=A0ABS7JCQ6_9SPHN|nr:TetR/AcrR family transcriptional regulator [Qipengyuania qiaonensis]MBX7483829.1 TetR/AcrR family transcriptional regulator [Qipengyuania qiaonensis]
MANEGTELAKEPRTERGRKTLRKLLDAATHEFADHGFHDASVSGITRRAGVALGSFYTYFDSKDAIFRALVSDMSEGVGRAARMAIAPSMSALEVERAALRAFLEFAAEHKEIYRIIDEAEFVDPESYRAHYETIGARIEERLRKGGENGEFAAGLGSPEAWAVMGINVFLGLRYVIWAREGDPALEEIAGRANDLLASGIAAPVV